MAIDIYTNPRRDDIESTNQAPTTRIGYYLDGINETPDPGTVYPESCDNLTSDWDCMDFNPNTLPDQEGQFYYDISAVGLEYCISLNEYENLNKDYIAGISHISYWPDMVYSYDDGWHLYGNMWDETSVRYKIDTQKCLYYECPDLDNAIVTNPTGGHVCYCSNFENSGCQYPFLQSPLMEAFFFERPFIFQESWSYQSSMNTLFNNICQDLGFEDGWAGSGAYCDGYCEYESNYSGEGIKWSNSSSRYSSHNVDNWLKLTSITCDGPEGGCMDPVATNYNPSATFEEGECEYDFGCNDHSDCTEHHYCHSGWDGSQYGERYCVEYYNGYCTDNMCGNGDGDCDGGECNDGICGENNCTFYSQGITTQADCCYKPGCTNPNACNYDETATGDDNSCSYPIDNCHDCAGECICDLDALGVCGGSCSSDADGDGICDDVDDCVGVVDDCGICNGPGKSECWDGTLVCDLSECDDMIYGCTDNTACNYNPDAHINDGSCDYPITDWQIPLLLSGQTLDGNIDISYTTPAGLNTIDNINEIFSDYNNSTGYIDYTFSEPSCLRFYLNGNILIEPTESWVGGVFEIGPSNLVGGCVSDINNNTEIDPLLRTVTLTDSGEETISESYISIPWSTEDCSSLNSQLSGISTNWVYVKPITNYQSEDLSFGCQDPDACNYDDTAMYNATCTYPIDIYNVDYVDCDGNCLNDSDNDGVCDEEEIVGCTNPNACNYDDTATEACSDCCEFVIDCLGVCGGTAVEDECGVCEGSGACSCGNGTVNCECCDWVDIDNDGIHDSIDDCVGIYDCLGVCNGNASFDECGICGGNNECLIYDSDGNSYKTVSIGNQMWMVDNLKTTHYNNGDEIPGGYGLNTLSNPEWVAADYGALAYYDDDLLYYNFYGLLYNWYAVDDNRGICPIGWRVPTRQELQAFAEVVGELDSSVTDGGANTIQTFFQYNGASKIKDPEISIYDSVFSIGWKPSTILDIESTNDYNWDAMPTGLRYMNGNYTGISVDGGLYGFYWSSSSYIYNIISDAAWFVSLSFNDDEIQIGPKYNEPHFAKKGGGMGVRCVKDIDVEHKGDVNLDGLVNIVDIIQITNHIMGSSSLSNQAYENADINNDGIVNVTDIIQIVDQIMNSGQMTPQQGEQIIDEAKKKILKSAYIQKPNNKNNKLSNKAKKQQLIDSILRKTNK